MVRRNVAWASKPVRDFPDGLLERLYQYKPGDQVTVGIIRDGAHLNLEVVLAKRPRCE